VAVIDQELLDFLTAHEVEVRALDWKETTAVERRWREIYGKGAHYGGPVWE
jgi:hypothetical protein